MTPPVLLSGGGAVRRAEEAFLRCVRENGMEAPLAGGVLSALSGGADSVLLFLLLGHYCAERGIPFAAVHVHHGLRGEEADRDETFCRALCARQGVVLFVCREDVPAYCRAHPGVGEEEGARAVRYAAFARTMEAHPEYAVCATAHTATDNLETLLFRFLRGSGLRGMCGIPPVRGAYLRPLLYLSREDILAALASLGQDYVTDSTNACTDYDRNYLRAEILPRLSRLRPRPEEAAARLAANLREEEAAAERASDAAYSACVWENRASVADICALPRATAVRVLARLYAACGGRGAPEKKHWDAVFSMLSRGRAHGEVPMPGGFVCLLDGARLSFRPAALPPPPEPYCIPLHEGCNPLPGGAELWAFSEPSPEFEKHGINVYNLFIQGRVKSVTILNKFIARSRRPQDAYCARGFRRDVRRMMTDVKLPHDVRAVLPVICDGEGIVWVPGLPIADRAFPRGSDACLHFYFCYQKKEQS